MTRRRALTLGRLVDQYEASLQLQGRRPRGIQTYRAVLDQMLDVLGADTDPRTLTHADMLEVVTTWLNTSPTTIAQRVSVLRSFGCWLHDEHDLPDPTQRLKRPRRRRPVRRRPDPATLAQLLRHATGRDRLIVAILAMTGMRVFELLGLRWRDVDETRCLIHIVERKGGKGGTIPIPAELAFLLRDTRAERAAQGLAHPDHFVVCMWQEWDTPTGGRHLRVDPTRPCGAATPYKILARLSDAVGFPRVAPHQLRRAYADAYLRAHPQDLVGLQFLMGHERIETTRDYLEGINIEQAAERLASVEFVTPDAADNEPTTTDPPHDPENPWKTRDSGGGGNRTRASVEPATQAHSGQSADPSSPGSDPDIVTRPDGKEGL